MCVKYSHENLTCGVRVWHYSEKIWWEFYRCESLTLIQCESITGSWESYRRQSLTLRWKNARQFDIIVKFWFCFLKAQIRGTTTLSAKCGPYPSIASRSGAYMVSNSVHFEPQKKQVTLFRTEEVCHNVRGSTHRNRTLALTVFKINNTVNAI